MIVKLKDDNCCDCISTAISDMAQSAEKIMIGSYCVTEQIIQKKGMGVHIWRTPGVSSSFSR